MKRSLNGFLMLISITLESFIFALWISRQNYINDVVWSIPLIVLFGVFGLMQLDAWIKKGKTETQKV